MLAERLGARALLIELHGLARRARLRLSAPVQRDCATAIADQANPFDLTERELDVLRLLAVGLTNREISNSLFISQNTAGVHVSHILAKLGVPNRAMAAAVAERLGLGPGA
jgi:DNA-binding NarL/FixJ family response regulator